MNWFPFHTKAAWKLSGSAADSNRRSDTIEAFNEFESKKKILSLVTYLKYEKDNIQGCVDHQDVDRVFRTGLLYVQDTIRGCLHISEHDLPEFLSPGNLLLMDPGQKHSVTKLARGKDHQMLEFAT